MENNFKRLIASFLLLSVMFSTLTSVNVSAQYDGNIVSNSTDWEPYDESDKFQDVFETNHLNGHSIQQEIISDKSVEELMASYSTACGDQYGYTGWSSLGAAQAYYGYAFPYFSVIPFFYCGLRYTHYYKFSNGSRMYFGVK